PRMRQAAFRVGERHLPTATFSSRQLTQAVREVGPPILFGLRLWASVCLALYIAFWLELDHAYCAGTSAAIACQPHLGGALRKGWFRMIGTVVGGVAIVVLTAFFPQERVLFLIALALWGAACHLAAQFRSLFCGAGRLYRSDHCERRARCDRRPEWCG